MFFQSYSFILMFLPLAVAGYFALNHFKLYRAASAFLLVMSLWFYGSFNIKFLPLIIISTVVNYLCGLGFHYIDKKWQRNLLFAFALVFNLGLLGYFKYSNFFIENINAAFGAHIRILKLVLPLGISFFTFQQLSYVIDSFKGEAEQYDFLDYSLFATFFPYVISGPIAFHHEIIPQFIDMRKRSFCFENFSRGMTSFAIGLFKKVLVADILAGAADWGFAHIGKLNTTTAIAVMLCYSFQLYFDFSGYCDMARGSAYMLNIELPQNFNSPYQATTIADFWKRWHMTMTRFFTKYIYFPLGGSRRGMARTCINTVIVFIVSGLWHGSGWNFLLWGAMHGLALALCKLFSKQIGKIKPALNWALTFTFVNIAWVFFRAETLPKAFEFCQKLFACNFGALNANVLKCFTTPFIDSLYPATTQAPPELLAVLCTIFLALCLVGVMQCKSSYSKVENLKPNITVSVAYALLFFVSLISISGVTTFLYFNF